MIQFQKKKKEYSILNTISRPPIRFQQLLLLHLERYVLLMNVFNSRYISTGYFLITKAESRCSSSSSNLRNIRNVVTALLNLSISQRSKLSSGLMLRQENAGFDKWTLFTSYVQKRKGRSGAGNSKFLRLFVSFFDAYNETYSINVHFEE